LHLGAPEEEIKFCIKAISKEKVPVDIIFVSKKWEEEIVKESLPVKLINDTSIPVVKPEGLIVLKLRAGSFQDIADVAKILRESEYNLQKLITLARQARVDKQLIRLRQQLGLTT